MPQQKFSQQSSEIRAKANENRDEDEWQEEKPHDRRPHPISQSTKQFHGPLLELIPVAVGGDGANIAKNPNADCDKRQDEPSGQERCQ